MNYGPILFLAAFFALAGSWFGLVLTPQMQVGQLQQTNAIITEATYPVARPGLARRGLEVYRANGCAYCHSQQVRQQTTVCDVLLNAVGTNPPAVAAALLNIRAVRSEADAAQFISGLPKPLLAGVKKEEADAALRALGRTGAKFELRIYPVGPEIERGWGRRRSVAEDFLFDSPVLLGSQRIGPDLANLALRQPDPNWNLRHLYSPRLEVKGSTMPPYRFLFETRRIERAASPDALFLPPEAAPKRGYEILPTLDAKALVAYLTSLRADAPLFDAPLTVAAAPAADSGTNAPAGPDGAGASAPLTNAPGK